MDRRDFMKTGSALLAGAAVGGKVFAQDALRHDGAGAVTGTEEENVEGVISHGVNRPLWGEA